MSGPLLSLDTSVELGLLQLANTTYAEVKPPTGNSAIPNQDYAVTQLTSEFNDIFFSLGKHKRIKAKLIVDENDKLKNEVHKAELWNMISAQDIFDKASSSFIIETDHQPLLPLFNNPHSRPPMRIERWLLYLQQFDYKLMYCPGNKNATRHMLPLTDGDTATSEARSQMVHHIIENTSVPKAITLTQVQDATEKDPDFRKFIPLIQAGNNRACRADPELAKYTQVFQELSYTEGIILCRHKLLQPKSLQQQIINKNVERKTLYELSMNRIVQTKLPSFTQVSPDPEVQQKDQDSKAHMKAYTDTKWSTKPHDLHIGNSALVKQKRTNKASPPFEPVPYTIHDIKGSMITASRSTDLKEITRNSSHFKKLGSPPGHARAESQYPCTPQQEPQAPVEFDEPEMHESSQPTSIQPEDE
ncbi:hypothetical protein AWC38_SpisGene4908 [Stylophora pistillata]|uniref:Reverse transcriptase RNase H-like domain-containing protein n=1 Tax=Stylophora pistillata TaxID=50429 RepID=A0A2B4SK75_STYPI|nr:hypothetical protein AWC38_SpisGene4908 [Stylophora pistillata]